MSSRSLAVVLRFTWLELSGEKRMRLESWRFEVASNNLEARRLEARGLEA